MDIIAERVKTIISKHAGQDKCFLNTDLSFNDDLGMDSLSVMEVVIELEERFEVILGERLYESVVTIGDAIGAVKAALDEQKEKTPSDEVGPA